MTPDPGPRDLRSARDAIAAAGSRAIEALATSDEALGHDPSRGGTALLGEMIDTLGRELISVVVFGNYSAGKSTLISSLLGAESLLPQRVRATTAAITRVTSGPEAWARVVFEISRVLGPLREAGAVIEELRSAEALVTMAGSPVLAMWSAQQLDDPGARSTVTLGDLRDAIGRCSRSKPGQPLEIPWQYLGLELAPRKPVVIPLDRSTPEGIQTFSADLASWVDAQSGAALGVRKVEIQLASSFTRSVFIDTPGIDSLCPQHRAATRTHVREAHAVVYLFNTRNLDLHQDDRQALTRLISWVPIPPDHVFLVGTFTDHVIDNVLDEEDMDEDQALHQIRRRLAAAFATIGDGDDGPLKDWQAVDWLNRIRTSEPYLVNAQDLGDPRLDGARLRDDLKTYLAATKPRTLLESTAQALLAEIRTRERQVAQTITAFERDAEEQKRRLCQLGAQIVNIAEAYEEIRESSPERLIQECKESISKRIEGITAWLGTGFNGRKSTDELRKRWAQHQKTLESKVNGKLQDAAEEIAAIARGALEDDDLEIAAPELGVAKPAPDMRMVLAKMAGPVWHVKRVLDFLVPLGLSKKNIRRARSCAKRELKEVELSWSSAVEYATYLLREQARPALIRLWDRWRDLDRQMRTARQQCGVTLKKLESLRATAATLVTEQRNIENALDGAVRPSPGASPTPYHRCH